jgi:cold shock protein
MLGSVIRHWGQRLFVMANGTVEFFNDTGGYGFISTDDGDLDDDEDVFFHMEDVGGEDLTEGTEVEFDIESSPKGPRAANVVRQ